MYFYPEAVKCSRFFFLAWLGIYRRKLVFQLLQVPHHAVEGALHLIQGGLIHIIVKKQVLQLLGQLDPFPRDVNKLLKVAAVFGGSGAGPP